MTDKECKEIINAVVNYNLALIIIDMLNWGKDFETALADRLKEIEEGK